MAAHSPPHTPFDSHSLKFKWAVTYIKRSNRLSYLSCCLSIAVNGLDDKFSNKYFPISTRNDDTNAIETHYHLHLVTNIRAHTTGTNNRNLSLGVPSDTLNSQQISHMLPSMEKIARFDSRRHGFPTQCQFAIPVQWQARQQSTRARACFQFQCCASKHLQQFDPPPSLW